MILDLHHVPNAKDALRLIEGFDKETGIAIALPAIVHEAIPAEDFSHVDNPRTLMALEIRRLRKFTDIPTSTLLQIIAVNKEQFSNSFNK